MFNKIQYRLLGSYLLVFASILVIFAVAVRTVFTRSLSQILAEKLTTLGQDAAENTRINQGQIIIDDDTNVKDLLAREQVLEWFDLQGNIVAKRGQYVPNKLQQKNHLSSVKTEKKLKNHLSHIIKKNIPKTIEDRAIKSVILPLVSSNNGQPIGYVRVSQSLKEFDENLNKLDWGIGSGIVVALILSGVSGIFLTRQAMKPIEDSFQRLKQFTADASHELRSPLMAIKTNAEVALKYPEGMRNIDQEKFQIIVSATKQITRLTEDLLFLARSDKLPQLDKKLINLTSILENLYQLYKPQFEAKSVELKLQLNSNLFLVGDSGQITRLFNNLIENALHYTSSRGTVEIIANLVGSHVEIKVQDTGIGISPENLDKIFERFWRADQSRSYWEGGSGLGLAIVQTIVQNHGGSITVTSQLEAGTCFTVCLPIGINS